MPPRGKCPEASQLYTVSLSESPDDLLKDDIDDLLDISLVEIWIPSHEAQYQLGLDHGGPQVKVTVVYGPNLGPNLGPNGRRTPYNGLLRVHMRASEMSDETEQNHIEPHEGLRTGSYFLFGRPLPIHPVTPEALPAVR